MKPWNILAKWQITYLVKVLLYGAFNETIRATISLLDVIPMVSIARQTI